MENSTDSSLPANLSQEISLSEYKNSETKEQEETTDEEALREKTDDLESYLQEAYELQRRTKRDLRREEKRLIWLQEELDETLRTIRDDRQRIMALHNEQSFTAKQIRDALSIDLKHYEATLRSKQPDLYGYCRQAANARDCLVITHSIRQCRRHIRLAEILIAYRYASFLSEKPHSIASPHSASHSTAAVTPTPAAKMSDGQSPVSSVQSSPLCPALASGGGGGAQSSLQGIKAPQLPVIRYQQTRTKTEKTRPRRLSLIKIDHRTTTPASTTTPVTTAPSTATTTTAPMASVDRTTASPTTTMSSSAATMSSSASTSHASLTSPRNESRDGVIAGVAGGGGGRASTDVVRVEMRECESRPTWISTRDVKPIVVTFVSK